MNDTSLFELRVIDGPQRGACSALAAGRPAIVGGDWSGDIVLRGEGLAECRISVTPHPNGMRLEVLGGNVRVNARSLQPGEAIELPLYTPLQLGDAVVALGVAGDASWARLTAGPAPEGQAPAVVDEPVPTLLAGDTRESGARRARRWSRWLVSGGGAVAAAAMGMLAFAYTAAPPSAPPQEQARRAEATLHAAGFPRLVAQPAPNGEVFVSGYLESGEERARVERLLASQTMPTRLSVWVNEQVAGAVLDVFRVNGVVAEAEVTGPGAVRVATHENDVARLEQIKLIARRDVPGLSVIEVRNAPPPAAPSPGPVVDDPGKRVASIVPGDPSYVVTADGTRYFEGALLPTGHRIAGIQEHEVLLEKGGTRTPLRF
ncbi:SctD/MshK family protein [Piscinibacter sp.]|uniref:SctD/MshK family protein n=1 Tax=Piscinibacter sp. TaxID=1903157 RepID=UPI002C873732|nr:hypothetical protein [Albitalea sp.]HUG22598.1 hypothetical protein [Albitalea sp.]